MSNWMVIALIGIGCSRPRVADQATSEPDPRDSASSNTEMGTGTDSSPEPDTAPDTGTGNAKDTGLLLPRTGTLT